MSFLKENSIKRIFSITNNQDYRDDYRRDYARVLHSPSFRRLEHKTQLFPGNESDYFRNRLTHSLEVAQIGKTVALKLQKENPELDIEPDVCEIAGLMHDLGHPPFGHNGEKALDSCMVHFGGFEGNAQTLRIISKLEKKELLGDCPVVDGKDNRIGLNLTMRVIASILKYDKVIPVSRDNNCKLVKGYYDSEKDLVNKIKELFNVTDDMCFKTIECSVMDLADDIAYSTYDIEDAFKAGFLTPYEMISADDSILEQIVHKLKKNGINIEVDECRAELYAIFADVWDVYVDEIKNLDRESDLYENVVISKFLTSYNLSRNIASDGYLRNDFTSSLINMFVNGIKFKYNEENPLLSRVTFDEKTKKRVNIFKHFSYVYLINSPRLKVVEDRGEEIVRKLFSKLTEENGYNFLPNDFQELYFSMEKDIDKKRVICDFIAGMTDRYALEFYGRLFSENPQTIFKPL
jgi:dGTPase